MPVAKNIVETVLKARDEMSKELTRAQRNMIRLRTVGRVTFKAIGAAAKVAWTAALGPIGQILAIVGAIAIPGTLVFALNSARKELDEIAKTADRINITTEALSELDYVAGLTGVSTNTLNLGLQRMVRRISEAAAGTGEAKKAIEELGLSAEDLNRLQADEQFKQIADAMSRVENEADKLRLATKLFDSEGARLVVTLKAGRSEIEKGQREAREFGLSLSRGALKEVENFNDALTRLQSVFKGAFRKIVVELAPILEAMANAATEFVKSGLDEFVATVAEVGVALARGFLEVARVVKTTVDHVRDLNRSIQVLTGDWEGLQKQIGIGLFETLLNGVSGKKSKSAKDVIDPINRALDALEDRIAEFRKPKRSNDGGPTFLESLIPGGADGTLAFLGQQVGSSFHQQVKVGIEHAERSSPLFANVVERVRQGAFKLLDLNLPDRFERAIDAVVKAPGQIAASLKNARIEEQFQEINSVILTVGDTVESSLVRTLDSVIDGTFRARDAIRDFGREVIRTFARLGARSLTSSIFGGGPDQPGIIQGFVRTLLSARGNAFESGQVVQRFARGGLPQGIVTEPTAFHMGLMGEGSRDEAIVPLGRMRNGDLGVRASGIGGGGGLTLVINGNVQTWGPQQFADYFFAALRSPEAARTIDSQQSLSRRTRPGVR